MLSYQRFNAIDDREELREAKDESVCASLGAPLESDPLDDAVVINGVELPMALLEALPLPVDAIDSVDDVGPPGTLLSRSFVPDAAAGAVS